MLLEGSGATRTAAVPLEVADDPCTVLLSSAGLLARTRPAPEQTAQIPTGTAPPPAASSGERRRSDPSAHDVIVSAVPSTARGTIGVLTSHGRLIRIGVLELPALPPTAHSPGLAGGAPVSEFCRASAARPWSGSWRRTAGAAGAGLALGTANGVVKRVTPDYPQNAADFDVIALKDGDRVVGAVQLADEEQDLVFITSDAQLLRFSAASVRPQGRSAAGMAGIRLAARAPRDLVRRRGPAAGRPPATRRAPVVVTVAGSAGALPAPRPRPSR